MLGVGTCLGTCQPDAPPALAFGRQGRGAFVTKAHCRGPSWDSACRVLGFGLRSGSSSDGCRAHSPCASGAASLTAEVLFLGVALLVS